MAWIRFIWLRTDKSRAYRSYENGIETFGSVKWTDFFD
jgi:hypothetical protein